MHIVILFNLSLRTSRQSSSVTLSARSQTFSTRCFIISWYQKGNMKPQGSTKLSILMIWISIVMANSWLIIWLLNIAPESIWKRNLYLLAKIFHQLDHPIILSNLWKLQKSTERNDHQYIKCHIMYMWLQCKCPTHLPIAHEIGWRMTIVIKTRTSSKVYKGSTTVIRRMSMWDKRILAFPSSTSWSLLTIRLTFGFLLQVPSHLY